MGVYKDKSSGKYGIRVRYYGKDWKKIIGDKRLAEIAWNEIQNEINLSKLAGQRWEGFAKLGKAIKGKTFAQAAEEFLQERQSAKASSIRSYKEILNHDLLPAFGKTPIRNITVHSLRVFQSNLITKPRKKSGEPLSSSRANAIMQVLRIILANEELAGTIEKNPCKAVKRITEPKADIDPLSELELQTALAACDRHYKPLFTVLAFTGARPNEMLALRWSDIDWRKEEISITKGRVKGIEGLPKTKTSVRLIPILPQVKEALEELKKRPVQDQGGHVFIDKKGKPIDKHLDRIWARALKTAGIRHRESYQLRHTFATHCILRGIPLPHIARHLGHTGIETLVRHYASWINDDVQKNNDKLREAFSPAVDTPSMHKTTDGLKTVTGS